MCSALACTILPPISPTIYFHVYSMPRVTSKQLTEVFLRPLASPWSSHNLLYPIAGDHPNIRLMLLFHSDRNPLEYQPLMQDRPRVRKIGPTRWFRSTRGVTISGTIPTDRGPPSWVSVWRNRNMPSFHIRWTNCCRDRPASVSLRRAGDQSYHRQLVP